MPKEPKADPDIRRQRCALLIGMLAAFPVTLALWLGIYYLLPPLAGMAEPLARVEFALGCSCVAILLCFLTGIEAVSHERLVTAAIDPLAGKESRRMKINLRYLQHTLEQLMLFIPGLLALAFYCADGRAMRAVAATAAVWIVSRAAFWIGYHYGPQYRTVGLTGTVQSMLVLLYVCARFGFDVAGIAGAAAPLILFAGIEAYLVYATRIPAR
ncbi:MAG TPA: MAPEG family protein [Stellaceae bacterium]|nr:MAPEG family protein [Stellaceae bacterium]